MLGLSGVERASRGCEFSVGHRFVTDYQDLILI